MLCAWGACELQELLGVDLVRLGPSLSAWTPGQDTANLGSHIFLDLDLNLGLGFIAQQPAGDCSEIAVMGLALGSYSMKLPVPRLLSAFRTGAYQQRGASTVYNGSTIINGFFCY